jgi:2-keto-4-pentenoate hydratase
VRRAAAALIATLAAAPAQAACPEMADVARFAQALLERRLPAPFPAMSEADAVCAQGRLVATLAQPWGDVSGHALAAEALPPIAAALFHANLRATSGATIEAAFAIRPAVAPGLLLRIGEEGRAVAAAPYLALLDLAAVQGAGRAARIAGNLGLRLGVAGAEAALDAAEAPMATLMADGGVMAAALGLAAPPAALLADFARTRAAAGQPMRPGERVALLGPAAPVAPRPGESWRLDVRGLGAATVQFR